jgi:hypothetical protein
VEGTEGGVLGAMGVDTWPNVRTFEQNCKIIFPNFANFMVIGRMAISKVCTSMLGIHRDQTRLRMGFPTVQELLVAVDLAWMHREDPKCVIAEP